MKSSWWIAIGFGSCIIILWTIGWLAKQKIENPSKEMIVTKIIHFTNGMDRIFFDNVSDSCYVDKQRDSDYFDIGQQYNITYNTKTGQVDGFQVNQNEK